MVQEKGTEPLGMFILLSDKLSCLCEEDVERTQCRRAGKIITIGCNENTPMIVPCIVLSKLLGFHNGSPINPFYRNRCNSVGLPMT